jgi:hypothetical protein
LLAWKRGKPLKYNFTSKQGDTWEGAVFTVYKNGVPVDLTDATIFADFYLDDKDTKSFGLSVGAGITITNAPNGIFVFDKQKFTDPPGVYTYDVEINTATIGTKTWIEGVLTITRSRSNNA